MKIVECVPNFSEGRDPAVIEAIADEIRSTEGAVLLDVDPGANTNRTVVTLVGRPEPVLEAAFRAIRKAAEVIDMRHHHGEHPRMGATDVCPFIPVSGMTMEECAELARRLGERVGKELSIPVYLYEHAASRPERKNLATVREGEYEGLKTKLKDPQWTPDFGPTEFNERSGATVIGAREFLIAYNININSRDKNAAHDIALTIREKGRWQRDEDGKISKDKDGNKIRQEGMFSHCKAIGWYIDEYNRAQISINFTNYKITPVHEVFEAARKLAADQGLRVTGSELVGLIPKDAMLAAGRYYLSRQGKSTGVPEKELIGVAVMSLGLNDISPFDPEKKIIEYRVDTMGKLARMNLQEFTDEISVDTPVPGGGSVAALCGSLSAALAAMVANLTYGKKGFEASWEKAHKVAVEGQRLKDFFVRAIDRDSEAFDAVMTAMRMPKRSDEEKAAREAALEEANKGAVGVPMETLRNAVKTLDLSRKIAQIGNPNAVSDAGVSAQCARTAAVGAAYNVLINLGGINDKKFVDEMRSQTEKLRREAEEQATAVDKIVMERLKG